MEKELELRDVWAVITRGWKVILSFVAISILAGFIISLISPRIYQAEALVSVPESSKLVAISSETKGTLFVLVNVGGSSPMKSKPTTVSLVNVPETKAILNQLFTEIRSKKQSNEHFPGLAAYIHDIRCDEIRGSENIFRLIVRSGRDTGTARDVLEKSLDYLNDNEFIRLKISEEVAALKQNIIDTEENLQRVAEIKKGLQNSGSFRQNPNFNPGDLEVTLNDLKIKINNLKNSLANVSGYRLLGEPATHKNPVKPMIFANISMSFVLGLMLGLIAVFVREAIFGRNR